MDNNTREREREGEGERERERERERESPSLNPRIESGHGEHRNACCPQRTHCSIGGRQSASVAESILGVDVFRVRRAHAHVSPQALHAHSACLCRSEPQALVGHVVHRDELVHQRPAAQQARRRGGDARRPLVVILVARNQVAERNKDEQDRGRRGENSKSKRISSENRTTKDRVACARA